MEIVFAGEVLADQGGADDLAVTLDQAAVGLVGEDRLGEAGHGEGIGEAGQDGHADDHRDGGADLLEHV